MADTQQPEALRLAVLFEDNTSVVGAKRIAAELRRQQARIAELEAQLASIGAGGVNGRLMAPAAGNAVAPTWWHKRADEIELQVAYTGSPDAMRCYTDMRTLLQAVTHPSPPEGMAGWISVDDRLPDVGVTVLVYEPFRHGEDWPDTVRIFFDYICPDYEGWHNHCESYEHFMIVGGVNACGPDVTCTGPSEKAPYTHWMPLPGVPASPTIEGESNV